jgi:hypothetical protein
VFIWAILVPANSKKEDSKLVSAFLHRYKTQALADGLEITLIVLKK